MRRPIHLLLILALLFTSVTLAACTEDDPPEPKATVRFIHSIDDLGAIEVLLDTEIFTTLQAGELSETMEIVPGRQRLAIRSLGAQSTLHEFTQDFTAQGYLMAFTGSVSGGTIDVLAVDTPAPDTASGMAAAEVVSLYEGQFTFDVYVGLTLIDDNIAFAAAPSFVEIPSGAATIAIYNGGDDPTTSIPIESLDHTFGEGEATMILLQNAAEGLGVAIELVPVRR